MESGTKKLVTTTMIFLILLRAKIIDYEKCN